MAATAATTALAINIMNMSVLPRIIPQFFAEDRWTIGRELAYNSWFILTCLFCTGFAPKLFGYSFSVSQYWFTTVVPLAWALTAGITVSYQIIRYRKNAKRAQHIRSGIRKRNRLTGDKDREVSFPVIAEGNRLSTSAYDIIYIQNNGHESTIGFRTMQGNVEIGTSPLDFRTIRESLRKLSNFYRCHRDWTVNMDKVTGIRSDALGFILETEQEGILIPVSSSLNDDLEGRLMK